MENILEVITKARLFESDASNTYDLITKQLNERQEQAFKRLQEFELSKDAMHAVDECLNLANASGARFGELAYQLGLRDGMELVKK